MVNALRLHPPRALPPLEVPDEFDVVVLAVPTEPVVVGPQMQSADHAGLPRPDHESAVRLKIDVAGTRLSLGSRDLDDLAFPFV